MILVIDNYDSFTYNLVQLFSALGAEVEVRRNDAISAEQALALEPTGIVVSPGPGTPDDAGISRDVIRAAAAERCAAARRVLGAPVRRRGVRRQRVPRAAPGARQDRRGHPRRRGLFSGVPSPFTATRYHSLCVDPASVPERSRSRRPRPTAS